MDQRIIKYQSTLSEEGLFWFNEVSQYVLKTYPHIPFEYAYQRPMFKITQQIFLMLGGGKHHFSIYTTDFAYVDLVKAANIKGLKFGKSAILFPHARKDLLEIAFKICDEVISRVQRVI